MDINMFFEFPGILILIGVVLLIISIVIGLVAYRKVDKEELVFSINEQETPIEEEPIMNEKIQEEVLIEEAPFEIIEEQKPNIIEESLNNDEYVELKEVEEEKVEDLPIIPEEPAVVNKKEEKTTIYGGNNPKKKFVFDQKEKTIYGEKQQEIANDEDEVEVL